MGLAAAGHDAARAGSDDAYDQWVLRQLGAFAEAVGVADAAERLAVARYLRAQSHSNILLRWVSKKSDTPRASILLRAIGKARSEPGCLALRGQQPPGREPGGVGEEAGGSGSGGHDHGIGGAATTTASRPHPFGRRHARPPSCARRPSLAPVALGRELRARGDSMGGALKRTRHVIARVL